MKLDEQVGYVNTMFSRHPELFPEQHREAILRGQILTGMTPFEAKLAGGAFYFKVVADTAIWPPNADPYKIMWAQSMQTDNSEIWMTFQNSTQFPMIGECTFRVHFKHGKAVDIEKLRDEKC